MMATEDSIVRSPDQGIMQQGTEEESSVLFESDSFRMYCYKVLPCAKRAAHEWTTCPWAHPGERARRRDPRVFSYLAIPCPDTKEGKECPRGDDCPNCHSLFEYWLHPSRYRTQLCRNQDGSHCKRQICFFAHSIEELRVPDHSHLNIPEEMKQQSINADGTSVTAAASHAASYAPKQATSSSSPSTSPKAVQSTSTHKGRKDYKHSGSGKGASKATGGSSAAGDLSCCGSLRGSLELSVSSSTPSVPVNSVTRQPSSQLQLPSAEQVGAMLASPVSAERMRRTVSLDAPGPAVRRQRTLAGPAVSSALFSSGMMADPEVGEPVQSQQALAKMQQQQQQAAMMMQMQQEQYEASMGAALAYEQHQNLAQLLMAQQQQQAAAWANSRGHVNASVRCSAEYATPPVSPTASSMLSSVMPDDTCSSGFTSLGSNSSYVSYGSNMGPGIAWRPQLPRALSGPPACSPHGGYGQSPAFRYQSVDSAVASAAAAAVQVPASAADYAAARVQMELMRSPQGQAMVAAAASMSTPSYSRMALLPQQQLQQQAFMQQPPQQKAAVPEQQLNLADVADLVDSVNRGEMGECGSQVLTGVIGLLMQQLQQQQLSV